MSESKINVRKIVFPKAYELVYEDEEWSGDVEEGNIMIKSRYSLISPGTELAFYTATHIDINNPANRWAKLPFYPGYASVGEVVAVGRSVDRVSVGDLVLADGHHASYDRLPCSEDYVFKLSPNIEPVHALFARLGEISMSALIHSNVRPGTTVVVLGMGLIGNLAAQLYSIQGARVIGVDVVDKRLEIGRSTNIAATVRTGQHVDLMEEVKRITGGLAPDIVVEATGIPTLINTALELVRVRGQVILLGSPRGTIEINAYKHIHSKGVSLVGAHANVKGIDGLPTISQLMEYVLSLIERKTLAIEPLITHMLPSSEAKKGYDMLLNDKDNALGVVLDWQ